MVGARPTPSGALPAAQATAPWNPGCVLVSPLDHHSDPGDNPAGPNAPTVAPTPVPASTRAAWFAQQVGPVFRVPAPAAIPSAPVAGATFVAGPLGQTWRFAPVGAAVVMVFAHGSTDPSQYQGLAIDATALLQGAVDHLRRIEAGQVTGCLMSPPSPTPRQQG